MHYTGHISKKQLLDWTRQWMSLVSSVVLRFPRLLSVPSVPIVLHLFVTRVCTSTLLMLIGDEMPNIPDETLWLEYAQRRSFHRLSSTDYNFAREVFLDGMAWAREQ